ncbi:MAG: phospho-N-acetylmuramoyl-pentapeptide-transferase [Oscillospiraceae bacterium]
MKVDIIISAGLGFLITTVLGLFLIPFLRKVKFGQPIIEEYGPTWHKKKQGTPTMGGIMFITGSIIAIVVGFCIYYFTLSSMGEAPQLVPELTRLVTGVVMMLGFCLIGFIDDYIKVVKKHNEGLTEKQKFIAQVFVATAYLTATTLLNITTTQIAIPFLGNIEFGWLYYPVCIILIVGIVNAVNITDGIDGLCSSITFFAAMTFMIISAFADARDVGIVATALGASLIGFLIYNFYPAKIMMGDTGSLFLGGALVAMAFSLNLPFLLILVGILYIIETVSVIIQRTYYKFTKKRLFKMTPIHHHFEMSGFSEVKIVLLFSVVEIIGCVLAVLWIISL